MNTDKDTFRSSPKAHPVLAYGVFFLIVIAILTYLFAQFPSVDDEKTMAGNLGLFLLINANIIVVMILVFLAGKNIITLALDRRRNILGSRLRGKLAAAFLALSLIPTILLFLVAKGILETVLQEWFSPQVLTTVEMAMGVAKTHYDIMNGIVTRDTRLLGRKISEISPRLEQGSGDEGGLSQETLENIQKLLADKREEYGLTAITVVDRSGREVAMSISPSKNLPTHSFQLSEQGMDHARKGQVFVSPEQFPEGQFLRGYAPISRSLSNSENLGPQASLTPARYFVVTDLHILPELSKQLATALDSYDDYRELRTYRRPLASSYLLTLIVVTLLIVFASVWVGFYLARGLSVPIGLLAQATAEVAHGNLDLRIPEVGDDELSVLVRSFNTMTSDLKRTTGELVQRRRYMETVFASLEVGVISMDTMFRITTINRAAIKILGTEKGVTGIGRQIGEVLPNDLSSKVAELGEELFRGRDRVREATVTITTSAQAKHLQLTLSKLTDDQEGSLGAVLLIDDISEVVSAQRMAAWREVARRIAHEIKNPLTPIQLHAERMQRKFRGREEELEESKLVAESTDAIVKQVDSLRNLVNEFSRFARMPKSNPVPADINPLIEETVAIFRGAHPEIHFRLELSPSLPQIALDREQMNRVFVNLFDNAVAAVSEVRKREEGFSAVVTTRSEYNSELGLVTVSVIDNGSGIARADLPRLFDPYFSTKANGTGLGLAIVSVIVSDHDGFIRAKNNEPRGAAFSIELPVIR